MCDVILLLRSCNRADSTLFSTLNARVSDHLVLMMSYSRLGDGAYVARIRLQHIGVVGWQDGGGGANNRAERIVQLLCFGLFDGRLEHRAFGCHWRGYARDGRMLVEVMVMVRCRTYDRTL